MTNHHNGDTRAIAVGLVGLAVSLVLVGIVSSTLVRHLIQIVPIVVVLIFILRWREAGSVALAIFVFWFVIMALIWLYLLGILGIAEGTYRATSIALTFVIAGFCVVGFVCSVRTGRSTRWTRRVVAFVFGLAFQYAFLWISLLPPFANR